MRALALAVLLAAVAAPLAAGAPTARLAAAQAMAYSDGDGNVYLGTTDGAAPTTLFTADGVSSLTPLSIAPDGSRVLVSDVSGGTDQLATLPAAGGSPALIDGTQGSTYGTFSPDGTSVVFSITPGVSDSLDGGIYTVPVAGGTPTRIVASPDGATDSLPALSPDGTMVAFVRETTAPSLVDALEIAPVAGGDPTHLVDNVSSDVSGGGRLAFSPDGTTIAYAGGFDTPGIFTIPAAGGSATQLTQDYDSWPSYTADGSTVVFARDGISPHADDNAATPAKPASPDVSELWTMAAGGSGAAVVAEGDFENLATTPYYLAPPPPASSGGSSGSGGSSDSGGSTSGGSSSSGGSASGGSSSSGGSTAGKTSTAKVAKSKSAKSIRVAKKGVHYTVTWKGKAAAWQVTLRVGAKKATVRVKGKVHRRAFTIRGAKGTPHATVKRTTLKKVKKKKS